MAVSLTHTKVSAKLDGPDATQVQPSDWNAEHTLTMGTGNVLGRTSAGTGATQEIAFSSIPATATGGSSSRTLAVRFGEVKNVKDYGALGDGSTNDATAIQAAITAAATAGGVVYFPPGVYLSASTINVPSNIELRGDGKGASIVKASASLPTGSPLLGNTNTGAYTDANITLRGLTFDGNGLGINDATQTRLFALLRFFRTTDLTVQNCRVCNYGYIGLGMNGQAGALIADSEFDTLGYAGTTANAGPAIWVSATSGVTTPTDIIIERNYIHDTEWHGCHFSVDKGSFSNNVLRRVKEAGMYLPKGGGQVSNQIIISGNLIDTVARHDISGHGIESEAVNCLITGNIMRNLAHGGIALTDVQNVTVSNNIIMDCCQYGVTGWGAIDFVCNATGSAAVKNIEVIGNRVVDTQSPQLTRHAVRLMGVGTPPVNMTIRHNHFADITFATSRYDFAFIGGNVRVYDNTGDPVNSTQELFQVLSGDRTGLDTDAAQEIFASATDALTVESGVCYEFELRLRLIRSAGTNSHQTGLLFGGTCTITSMDYAGFSSTASGGAPAAPLAFWGITQTYNQVVGTSTAADENIVISARGVIRVPTGGTLIPQFKYTAAPGGAPTIKRGTLFRLRAIGVNTVTSVGPWA